MNSYLKRLLRVLYLGTFILSLEAVAADNYRPDVLRIGYQKYGTLVVLKARGDLERALAGKHVSVRWLEFPTGPRLLEALNLGAVDFGVAGDGPPVFAQAAGAKLLYVGYEPPSPGGIAFVVHRQSHFQHIRDLIGKKIAVSKGGNVHVLLLRALQANGLKPGDVIPNYLGPSEARAAFENGAVDAWVAWDPYLANVEHTGNARILLDGRGLSQNHQFYFASEPLAAHRPEVVDTVLAEIKAADVFTKNHIDDVAARLAPQIGMDKAIVLSALQRMGFGVAPLTPAVIRSQQSVADLYYQAGLIPKPVRVEDVVWKRN